MVQKNLNIGDGLRRRGIENSIQNSLAWKTILQVYEENYHSKILEKYLLSVQFRASTCIVKTQKWAINAQLLPLREEVEKKLSWKLEKVGIKVKNLSVKFI